MEPTAHRPRRAGALKQTAERRALLKPLGHKSVKANTAIVGMVAKANREIFGSDERRRGGHHAALNGLRPTWG